VSNLISTKDLAQKLAVTEVTIWRWRKQGMPFLKLNNSIRFELETVMNWLQERGAE
jgi:predicted DNA-binding transcriptional regulator AlpA